MLDENKEELLEDTLEELVEETGQWTQTEALYVVVPEITSQCSVCSFYNAGTCELVEGSIDPQGHCRFWVDKEEVIEEPQALSQSIEDLEADEDFLYILALMQDDKLPNYKFETLLDNLAADIFEEKQELSVSLTKKDKSESGGLTAAGRAKFNRAEGSNLKPGVKGKATTPEQMRRKGSYLRRFFAKSPIPPLKLPNGKPSRFALSAAAWGEPVPSTVSAVRKLAAKGEALLKRYAALKEKSKKKKTKEKLSQSESQPIAELPICLSNGMVKIPIAKKGSWFHEEHGLVTFTDKDFEQIKKESSKEVLGFTPYLTYGHPKNLKYDTIDGELKSGDLAGWEESDDTLFGLFDTKEDVFEMVKKGDYEYSSGEFLRNYKDKFTGTNKGTVLMRVALTNSPFIPFGDTKIEALSTNSHKDEQGCLPSPISYVIKLSTDIQEINQSDLPNKDIPEPDMQDKTPQELAEDVVKNLSLDKDKESSVQENQVNESTEIKKEEVKEEVKPTSVSNTSSFSLADVNSLIETITSKASESFKVNLDAVTAKYETLITSLNEQIGKLNEQIVSQQEVTQAFSTTLSNQTKTQEYRELASKGVSATLIQKFSQIQNALETKQSVIKLSTKASDGQVSESEISINKAIKELLLDAVNTEAVQVQQFGQSVKGPTGLMAEFQNLAAKNRELASKKSV